MVRLSCLILMVLLLPREGRCQALADLEVWEAVPDWDVGEWDGPVFFTRITDLFALPDGRVFLTQPDDGEVRVFDLDGNQTGVIGRRGEGPGEFRSPHALFWRNDTLLVWDNRLFRLNILNPEGELLESYPAGLFSREIGVLRDGSIISTRETMLTRDLVSGEDTQIPLVRLPPNGSRFDTLSMLRVDHWQMEVNTGFGKMYGPQPFSDHPLWEVSFDGEVMLLVERGVDDLEEDPAFRLTRFDSTGRTIGTTKLPFDPIPLRRSTVVEVSERQAREVRTWREALGRPTPEGTFTANRFRDAYYVPPVHPPVEDVAVGSDHSIWLRRETVGGDLPATWTILSKDAEPVAEIALPSELRQIFPTPDYVFGVRRDEMDVYHLVRYSIRRRTRHR